MILLFKGLNKGLAKSVVGAYQGNVTNGSVSVSNQKGHGATKAIRYIHGDASAHFSFGPVLKKQSGPAAQRLTSATVSMCSISRYTGKNKNVILYGKSGTQKSGTRQRDGTNWKKWWVFGHLDGMAGVAGWGKRLVSAYIPVLLQLSNLYRCF